MQTENFRVVYDILQEGYGVAPFLLAVILIGLTILFYFMLSKLCEGDIFKKSFRDFSSLIALVLMMLGVGLGTVNIFLVRRECLELAREGNVSVTQGVIKNFANSKHTSFSINHHNFSYSKNDLTKCGFNQNHDYFVSEGMKVRISFADGCILKLEVSK